MPLARPSLQLLFEAACDGHADSRARPDPSELVADNQFNHRRIKFDLL